MNNIQKLIVDDVSATGPGHCHGYTLALLHEGFASVDELLNFLRDNHFAIYWKEGEVFGIEKIPDYRYVIKDLPMFSSGEPT